MLQWCSKTWFSAQWHHLAAAETIHSLIPLLWSFLHKPGRTALAAWRSVGLPLLSILSLSRSHHVPPPHPSVADSSPPQERWGAKRKQRFGSVVLIDLDFLQIGWKIRRSFYSYTAQSLPPATASHDCRPQGLQLSAQMCHLWQGVAAFLPKTRRGNAMYWTQVPEQREQKHKARHQSLRST